MSYNYCCSWGSNYKISIFQKNIETKKPELKVKKETKKPELKVKKETKKPEPKVKKELKNQNLK